MAGIPSSVTRGASILESRIPWQLHVPLFLIVYLLACLTLTYATPDGETITFLKLLEDFGVYVLFLGLWIGVFAHFRRTMTFGWLVAIAAFSLFQEEVNFLNLGFKWFSSLVGHTVLPAERQRGDVFTLGIVFTTLIGRFIFQRGFRSFMRIHITFFLVAYTTFLCCIHYLFAYYIQGELLEQRMLYQKELTASYPGRFKYQCDQLPIKCFEWVGNEIPAEVLAAPSTGSIIESIKAVRMSVTGWLDVFPLPVDETDTVLRGVEASQKVIVTAYKNDQLYRVVFDEQYPAQSLKVAKVGVLSFSTTFIVVWFFGGMFLVFMHQARSRKRTSGGMQQ
ncbi:hypothetical protein H8F21_15630 [Pseudomonas sp. P66]|uniref:Transmembrane protein n=1 Tax=Pseudomonas arcuscaelestis TaxID=2710591 RepID=A0ABS2BZE0_9PSED|nr:hypothetical protein [Pseudomonas arcuscaelestis]